MNAGYAGPMDGGSSSTDIIIMLSLCVYPRCCVMYNVLCF